MAQTLMIETKEEVYPIYFVTDYGKMAQYFDQEMYQQRKVCIVTDNNVKDLYLEHVKESIRPFFKEIVSYVMPAGEDHKHLTTVYQLYEYLIQHQFDRHSMLIALGGGVVGDLTGFTAATFLRGIEFVQCPTTLLSQVDSSIGGKTGVDFNGYKNMIGAFYQPKMVIINTSALKTLSTRQFQSGMAEIIKHAFIKDKDFLNWLEENQEAIQALSSEELREMIYKSGCIKKDVVQEDAKELNIRALLNFGHTVGHAIEKLLDFEWLHGECVAVGMVLAGFISYKRGHITLTELKRMEAIIHNYGLPTRISNDLTPSEIIKTTKYDKKVRSSVLHFVLLEALGKGKIVTNVKEDELITALDYLQSSRIYS